MLRKTLIILTVIFSALYGAPDRPKAAAPALVFSMQSTTLLKSGDNIFENEIFKEIMDLEMFLDLDIKTKGPAVTFEIQFIFINYDKFISWYRDRKTVELLAKIEKTFGKYEIHLFYPTGNINEKK